MFKRGGRLAARPGASAQQAAAGGGGSSASGRRGAKGEGLEAKTAGLERKVANCLSCGKIFDCRNVTNDILRFIGARAGLGRAGLGGRLAGALALSRCRVG